MNDAALGALTGSAFSVVYALLGLWFGRLADRTDRLRLVRIGACVWSFASLGAAFASSYAWLIAARAGVAVGEAFATAAAFSLVAELCGARRRARALSRRADGVVAGRSAFDATLGNTAFRWFLVAFSAVLFLDSSAEFWLIPFAQRRYTIGAGQSGAELGGMLLLGGAAGCLGGGWFADRWQARSRHGRTATAAGAFTIEVAALLGAVMQPDYGSFLWCFGVFCVASGAWAGLAAAIGLDLVPRAHHSSAVAIYFLFTTLTGPALGPFVTGILSGRLGSVGNALIVSCLVAPLALWGLSRLAGFAHDGRPGGSDKRSP